MERERKYKRITWTYRLKIEALYNAGHSYRFISHELGFSPSAIHYEVKHGLYEHLGAETTKRPVRYSAQLGQDYADNQATVKGVPIKLGHRYDYAAEVASAILSGISPDVVVGRMRREGKWTVSTATLYRYIDQGYIPGVTNKNLQEKPKRKRKKDHVQPAARPPRGKSIEDRPREIKSRDTFGHWELDSVIGKSAGRSESILTFIERLTRYTVCVRVRSKEAASTVKALDSALSKFPKGTFKSLTVDNGCEFSDCYGMEHDRHGNKRLDVYYCHPYTSCERGSGENVNRLYRRYFPKGKSLRRATQRDCTRAAAAINDMPRRILNYATAAELFALHLATLQNSVCPPQK